MLTRIFSLLFVMVILVNSSLAQEYQNKEILFCIKADRAPLKIQHKLRGVQTDRPIINRLLQRFGVVEIEKWLPMADARDVVDGVKLSHIYRVVFKDEKSKNQLTNILKNFRLVDDVQSAALEAVNRIASNFEPYIPNDPYFPKQWYLNKIMAPNAWGLWGNQTPGDSTVLVGVVDTGIDYTHPDLANALWVNLGEDANGDGKITDADKNGVDDDGNGYVDDFMGWDFADQDNDVMPPDPGPHQELSHGTHVSGVIAAVADNGIGIAGISFRSKLIVTKHAADNDLTSPNIVNGYSGVLYCAKMGAKIINCSWGGPYDFYGKIVVDNVTRNYDAIVVAAAGNDSHNNDDNPIYPSDYANTISVAALNNADKKAYYSNWGKVVDISAPGGEGGSYYNAILSTIHVSAGSYASWQGTSMATPVVAGAFALLKAWFPNDSRSDLINRLLRNADPIDSENPNYKGLLGTGRVNVYNAIAQSILPKISLQNYYWQTSDSSQLQPGDSVRLYFSIKNANGWKNATGVKIKLRSNSSHIQILDSLFAFDSLRGGQTIDTLATVPSLKINSDAPYRQISLQLVLTANDTSKYSYSQSYDLTLMPTDFQKGFPVNGYAFNTPLGVVKLRSGQKVIVAVTSNGQLVAFTAQGKLLSGFPVNVGTTVGAPAIADVNRDGNQDIVIVNRQGTVWVVDFSGKIIFKDELKESVYGDVALANMDDDPQLEIVFGTMHKNLHVLKLDSSEVNGFPKVMPSFINLGTALADFDNDSLPDIVLGTFNSELHVITAHGDSLKNFPITLPSRLVASPIVVRDGDSLFIIAVTIDHKIFKIDQNGKIGFEYAVNGDVIGEPAVADLDGDGKPEILLTSQDGYLHVLNFSGQPFSNHFPLNLNGVPQIGPLCQDVNDDGVPEILAVTDVGILQLLHVDGSEFKNFPADLGSGISAMPVIGDLDADGDAEIVLGGSDRLFALNLNSKLGSAKGWNTYQGNNQRTGTYGVKLTAIKHKRAIHLPQKLTLYPNYPNPFNMQTVIRFYLPQNVRGQKVTLMIYNVLGQKVQSFRIASNQCGQQRLIWNGTNQAGKIVTSGIYFYRLIVGQHSLIHRMLLLK